VNNIYNLKNIVCRCILFVHVFWGHWIYLLLPCSAWNSRSNFGRDGSFIFWKLVCKKLIHRVIFQLYSWVHGASCIKSSVCATVGAE